MMGNRGTAGLLTCVALAVGGALVSYLGCTVPGGGGLPTPSPSGTSTPTPLPTPSTTPTPTPTPPGRACIADGDCDDELFCNGTERCVDLFCTEADEPCDPITEDCDEDLNACVPGDPGCTSDADCDFDEDCDLDTGVCVPADLECVTDEDCDFNEVCDVPTGACVPATPECTSDADCQVYEDCDVITGKCVISSVCGPGAGPCNIPNSSPGCENPDCCEDVCQFDPACCVQEWDQGCADLAFSVSTCLQP